MQIFLDGVFGRYINPFHGVPQGENVRKFPVGLSNAKSRNVVFVNQQTNVSAVTHKFTVFY